jgi:hypothetical protein
MRRAHSGSRMLLKDARSFRDDMIFESVLAHSCFFAALPSSWVYQCFVVRSSKDLFRGIGQKGIAGLVERMSANRYARPKVASNDVRALPDHLPEEEVALRRTRYGRFSAVNPGSEECPQQRPIPPSFT